MQQVSTTKHQWTRAELVYIDDHYEHTTESVRQMVKELNSMIPPGAFPVTYFGVQNQARRIASAADLPTFNYTAHSPLKSLFTRCPICGGTTTVNEVAYCRSCCLQWNPITLKQLKGLHKPDGF